jgi:hypothetical protein
MTGAKEHAPLETSTMMNSAFRRIEGSKTDGWQGVAGFANGMSNPKKGKPFNYAFFLHETTNWSPRPPSQKQGPAWNPDATPKFLERGFTDKDQIAKMQKVIGAEYKI